MDDGAAIRGIIGNTMPPPPPVPISLPRAWVDVLFHYKSERFRQWFPWVSRRWMAASFALSTALVVLGGAESALLVFIFPVHGGDAPEVPHAVFTFVSHIVGSVGTTFAMALGVALIMDRAYGPLRIRFREYALRPWLLAQPAICLALLIGYPWSAWVDTVNIVSLPFSNAINFILGGSALVPFGYSLTLSLEAFSAGSGRGTFPVFWVLLLAALFVFLLTWALPAFVAAQLGHPLV